jgi:uncharacterized protein (TIGR02246 family)
MCRSSQFPALCAALRPVLAALVLFAGGTAGTAAAAQKPDVGVPDWNGVWERTGSINWDPRIPDGQLDRPRLTTRYQARYDAVLAARATGHTIGDPTAACLPPGMPRIMNMVYPMEIFQRPGQVAIFAEWQSQVRRIHTDGRSHPEDLDRSFNGHSIGHWQGRDLLVDTIGMREEVVLTQTGIALSGQLRVTERFHQVDATTLTDTITLIDPEALAEPWTVIKTFHRAPKTEILEYVCEENNRNPILADGSVGVTLPKAAPDASSTSSDARLRAIEDRQAIERLLVEYGRTLDARDFGAYAGLFARDGEWKGALGSYQGPVAIQAAMTKIFTDAVADIPKGRNFHVMSNFRIDVQGDHATARSNFIFYKLNGSTPEPAVAGRYEDELIREDGAWRFLRRTALPPG